MQILALWAAISSWAGAQTIIQHVGANNPTNEGFLLSNGTTMPKFPTNDGGILSWTIVDTNAADNFVYFKNFTSAQRADLADGWHVLWKAKAIDAPAPRSWEISFSLTNDTGNARRYLAAFEKSGADMIVDLVTGPAFTVLGKGDGFHTWEFKRSTPGTDVAEFWVDDVFLTNYAGFNDFSSNIEWGSLPHAKTSHVEWAWVLVEVPEPSSLLLIGVATGIGLLSRRRK